METTSYTSMYQDPRTAAAYDETICRSNDDAVWAAERGILTGLIRKHLVNPRSCKAVDFACGTGRISEAVKPLVASLTGLDISEAMLERARQRVPGVDFRRVDVLETPEEIPDGCDLITSFRFLLLAEPPLREACIRALARRLKPGTGAMILNTHGNPRSFRAIAALKDRIRQSGRKLPSFSLRDMRALAERCGLRLVDASGCGFVPNSIGKLLPRRLFALIERSLAGLPGFWRFGSNLVFVLVVKSI
jgi:SAM-dependent methyltransferase